MLVWVFLGAADSLCSPLTAHCRLTTKADPKKLEFSAC